MLTEYKDLLSVQDLSQIFEVSEQTIYKEIKQGKFSSYMKIGRKYLFPKVEIFRQFFYQT